MNNGKIQYPLNVVNDISINARHQNLLYIYRLHIKILIFRKIYTKTIFHFKVIFKKNKHIPTLLIAFRFEFLFYENFIGENFSVFMYKQLLLLFTFPVKHEHLLLEAEELSSLLACNPRCIDIVT